MQRNTNIEILPHLISVILPVLFLLLSAEAILGNHWFPIFPNSIFFLASQLGFKGFGPVSVLHKNGAAANR